MDRSFLRARPCGSRDRTLRRAGFDPGGRSMLSRPCMYAVALAAAVSFIGRGGIPVIAVVAVISAVTASVAAAVIIAALAIAMTAAVVFAAMPPTFFTLPVFLAPVVMRFFPAIAGIVDSEGLLGDLPDRLHRVGRYDAGSAGLCLRVRRCETDREGEKRNEKRMFLHGTKVLTRMNFSVCAGSREKGTCDGQS